MFKTTSIQSYHNFVIDEIKTDDILPHDDQSFKIIELINTLSFNLIIDHEIISINEFDLSFNELVFSFIKRHFEHDSINKTIFSIKSNREKFKKHFLNINSFINFTPHVNLILNICFVTSCFDFELFVVNETNLNLFQFILFRQKEVADLLKNHSKQHI